MSNYTNSRENFTWFYKNKCIDSDKIGISSDGTLIIHDGIINRISLYKKVRNASHKTLRLIYKIDNQPNLMRQAENTLIYFKFTENKNDIKSDPFFSCIGFNGGEYEEIDEKLKY